MSLEPGGRQLHASHKTYRIRRIPGHVDPLQLVRLLVELDPRLGPSDGVSVMSLAPDLGPHANTQTSTVMFDVTPSCFYADEEEWPFGHVGMTQDLIIDVHFRGFTVLNKVQPSLSTVDCIAISGLGSHPFGSWRSRDPRFMWLRDQLCKDAPQIRVVLWGYDTQILDSKSFQTIEDLATRLVDMLKNSAAKSNQSSPTMFLAHSLGGIILKQALVYLAAGDEADRNIVNTTCGIVNFGVPARGMSISSLRAMVKGQPNLGLLNHLEEDANFLVQLQQDYQNSELLKNIRVKSVYETKLSATAIEVTTGIWERKGPFEILVRQDSAIHSGSPRVDIIPINKDHSGIAKFAEGDEECPLIISHIKALALLAEVNQNSGQPADTVAGATKDEPSSLQQNLHRSDSIFYQTSSASELHDLRLRYYTQLNYGDSQHIDDPSIVETTRALPSQQFLDMGHSMGLDHIAEADRSTFEWVFEDETLKFREWLQNCQGIYWIQGKPGSGKSTLMHFILKHPSLQQTLSVQGNESRRCISLFFDEGGDRVQQSFKGLLARIIGSLISRDGFYSDPLERTFLEMALSKRPFDPSPAWDLRWLQILFTRLLQQDYRASRIYLFLDALDEYSEDKDEISDFLIHMTSIAQSSPKTKLGICFSSRSWPIFEKKFSKCPGFHIHDHTGQDIRQFTQARLQELDRLLRSATPVATQSDQALTDIVSHISTKASGVFLWVVIVVKELERAFADGITEPRMLEILDVIPEQLENLYDLALGRIDARYHLESYIMLEIMLRAEGDVFIDDFVCAMECAMLDYAEDCINCFNKNRNILTSKESINNQIRRIKSRCAGLIEMKGEYRLQFMHQTVKDYLLKPGLLKRRLGNHASLKGQNGHSFWSKFELVSLHQKYEGNAWVKFEPNAHVWLTLQHAESTSGLSHFQFLDSIFMEDVLKSVYFDKIFSTNLCWVAFAWRARLRLYMLHMIRAEFKSGEWPKKTRLHLISETIRFTARMRQTVYPEKTQKPSGLLTTLAKELLESGADLGAVGPDGLNPLDSIITTAHKCMRATRYWQLLDIFEVVTFIRSCGGLITSASQNERLQLASIARDLGHAGDDWMSAALSDTVVVRPPKSKFHFLFAVAGKPRKRKPK